MKKILFLICFFATIASFPAITPQNIEILIAGNQVEVSWDAQETGTVFVIYTSNDPRDLVEGNLGQTMVAGRITQNISSGRVKFVDTGAGLRDKKFYVVTAEDNHE